MDQRNKDYSYALFIAMPFPETQALKKASQGTRWEWLHQPGCIQCQFSVAVEVQMTTAKKTRNPKLLRIYDSIVYIYIHIDIDYRLQIYVCVCLMWYIFVMSYAELHHINHRVKHKYGLITAGHKKFVRFIPDLCCSIWIGITISIAVDSSSSISMVRDWQKPPLGALPTRIKTSCNDW